MRKFISIVFIFSMITLFACEKYPFLPDDYSRIFLDEWKWIGTSCPFTGSYQDADSVNYTRNILFDKNGYYHSYKNDTLLISKKYKFHFDKSIDGINHYKITFNNDPYTYFAFIITNDNKEYLVFGEYNPDTCEQYYLRQ